MEDPAETNDYRFISYKGRSFLVPDGEIEKLLKDQRTRLRANYLAIDLGGPVISEDGIFNCNSGECNHYCLRGDFEGSPGIPGVYLPGCQYKKQGLEYTIDFEMPDGRKVKAIADNCVVKDCEIEYLLRTRQLDRYETGEIKVYPRARSLYIENFCKSKPRKKRSLLSKLSLILRNCLKNKL